MAWSVVLLCIRRLRACLRNRRGNPRWPPSSRPTRRTYVARRRPTLATRRSFREQWALSLSDAPDPGRAQPSSHAHTAVLRSLLRAHGAPPRPTRSRERHGDDRRCASDGRRRRTRLCVSADRLAARGVQHTLGRPFLNTCNKAPQKPRLGSLFLSFFLCHVTRRHVATRGCPMAGLRNCIGARPAALDGRVCGTGAVCPGQA